MRTTVDLPDPLFRRTKALAAARGSSMKDLIIRAVEREVSPGAMRGSRPRRVHFPLIRSRGGPKLDLSNFDFDDLLA